MGVHVFLILNPLPPSSPYQPSGSSQCTSPKLTVSCIKPGLAIRFLYDIAAPAAAAKSLQSCPTLCDPVDGSPPGSPVPGIPQARILEWVAISFSNVWKWKVKVKSLSHVQLLATTWTSAFQAPPCFNGIFQNNPPPHPRAQKTVLYICVSFAVSHTGLWLQSF